MNFRFAISDLRLLLCAICVLCGVSASAQTRVISRTNDVRLVRPEDQLVWFQGETVEYNLYARRGGVAVAFSNDAIPVWSVTDDSLTNFFVRTTGTVINATNGHARWILSASQSALTSRLYQSFGFVTGSGGALLGDRAVVLVRPNAAWGGSFVGPDTNILSQVDGSTIALDTFWIRYSSNIADIVGGNYVTTSELAAAIAGLGSTNVTAANLIANGGAGITTGTLYLGSSGDAASNLAAHAVANNILTSNRIAQATNGLAGTQFVAQVYYPRSNPSNFTTLAVASSRFVSVAGGSYTAAYSSPFVFRSASAYDGNPVGGPGIDFVIEAGASYDSIYELHTGGTVRIMGGVGNLSPFGDSGTGFLPAGDVEILGGSNTTDSAAGNVRINGGVNMNGVHGYVFVSNGVFQGDGGGISGINLAAGTNYGSGLGIVAGKLSATGTASSVSLTTNVTIVVDSHVGHWMCNRVLSGPTTNNGVTDPVGDGLASIDGRVLPIARLETLLPTNFQSRYTLSRVVDLGPLATNFARVLIRFPGASATVTNTLEFFGTSSNVFATLTLITNGTYEPSASLFATNAIWYMRIAGMTPPASGTNTGWVGLPRAEVQLR